MTDLDYEKIIQRTRRITGIDRGGSYQCIDDIVAVWRKHHKVGVQPFIFCCLLLEVALGIMIRMSPLEDAEAFARYVRDGGEATRKIISEEWPLADTEGHDL